MHALYVVERHVHCQEMNSGVVLISWQVYMFVHHIVYTGTFLAVTV